MADSLIAASRFAACSCDMKLSESAKSRRTRGGASTRSSNSVSQRRATKLRFAVCMHLVNDLSPVHQSSSPSLKPLNPQIPSSPMNRARPEGWHARSLGRAWLWGQVSNPGAPGLRTCRPALPFVQGQSQRVAHCSGLALNSYQPDGVVQVIDLQADAPGWGKNYRLGSRFG